MTVIPGNHGSISCEVGGSEVESCAGAYATGTVVELYATGAEEKSGHFEPLIGWTGACSGTVTPCTLTMTGDETVGATFREASLSSGSSPGTGPATGSHLSATAGTAVKIVGVDVKAKIGTKVNAKLSGKTSKSTTLKVSSAHTFSWSLGKLRAGSYTVKFTIGGKVIKTATITVKAAPK